MTPDGIRQTRPARATHLASTVERVLKGDQGEKRLEVKMDGSVSEKARVGSLFARAHVARPLLPSDACKTQHQQTHGRVQPRAASRKRLHLREVTCSAVSGEDASYLSVGVADCKCSASQPGLRHWSGAGRGLPLAGGWAWWRPFTASKSRCRHSRATGDDRQGYM